MGGAEEFASSAQARDFRLFGERPVLQIETSLDRPLGETALVKAAEKSFSPHSKSKNLDKIALEKGVELGYRYVVPALKITFGVMSFAATGALVVAFPQLVLGLVILALVTVGNAVLAGKVAGKVEERINPLLAKRHRLALEKNLLALPEATELGDPYRGSGSLSQVRNLIREIFQPRGKEQSHWEKTEKELGKIDLLGATLRSLPTNSAEFGEGIAALLKVWVDPPVVRHSYNSWEYKKMVLRESALKAFVNTMEGKADMVHLKGSQFISLTETALEKLRSKELIEDIYHLFPKIIKTSDDGRASYFIHDPQAYLQNRVPLTNARSLLQIGSDLLGPNHPQVVKTRKALNDYEKALLWNFEREKRRRR